MSIETVKLPAPIYPCHIRGCAEQVSYPPEDLTYVPHCELIGISGHMETWEEGFYCFECLGHHDFPVDGLRHTLRDVIDRRARAREDA